MQCPHCQQENPAQAKFCLACGRQLRRTCSGCGTELPGHARYCIECGQSTELPAGSAAGPAEPSLPPAPPVAAGAARVILDRDEVLDALYHQGRAALGRGDRAGAAVALAPVAAEAPERYPDAAAQLAQAQRPGPGDARDAPRRKNGVGLTNEPWQRGATVEGSSWAEDMRALGAALARGARRAADSPRLRPLGGRLAILAGPHRPRAWAVGALIGAVLLFVLFAERSGPTDTRAAGTPEAAPVPTVVPDAEVFARCDGAVAASNWADAIRECRTLQARDADYAGLADKLAAAYVGRGEQRLAQGDDLGAAKSDFEEALRFRRSPPTRRPPSSASTCTRRATKRWGTATGRPRWLSLAPTTPMCRIICRAWRTAAWRRSCSPPGWAGVAPRSTRMTT